MNETDQQDSIPTVIDRPIESILTPDQVDQISGENPPEDSPSPESSPTEVEAEPFLDEGGIVCYYKTNYTMDRAQISITRKPGLRDSMAILSAPKGHHFEGYYVSKGVSANDHSWVERRSLALVQTVRMWMSPNSVYSPLQPGVIAHILDKGLLARKPKSRQFDFFQYVNVKLSQMLKVAPKNPALRDILRGIFGKRCPDEEDEYEKIKAWYEYNVETPPRALYGTEHHARYRRILEGLSPEISRNSPAAQDAIRANPPSFIAVSAFLSFSETGSCEYQNSYEGIQDAVIPLGHLEDVISNSENRDEVYDEVKALIETAVHSADVRDDSLRKIYSDYRLEDSDKDITVSAADVEQVMRQLRVLYPRQRERLDF